MSDSHNKIQRFVVLAETYSRLTVKKSGNDMSGEEMEGLYYSLVMQCSSPDKFYALVEHKKTEDGTPEGTANNPATANDRLLLTDDQPTQAHGGRAVLLRLGFAKLIKIFRKTPSE